VLGSDRWAGRLVGMVHLVGDALLSNIALLIGRVAGDQVDRIDVHGGRICSVRTPVLSGSTKPSLAGSMYL